ncbi:hybrid sensor histidine kinase/response regulator [Eubacterium oxidoreducens]|uniref:Stage 0 sporulation protein A homolog n=1 Tax=Eubacterium oxidoreducens TaxID=1732 RepID=A0A1G6A544_EUBOX|nr:response regulator [Eubacterium oxidoreducens]SDB03571.1 His Kinase A (phospho-acceptor) domain-containing protein [Eubacterium oxidoreducens]
MEKEYKSIKEIAQEWDLTVRRVQMLCTSGKLPGAKKVGNLWAIPADVKRPIDKRMAQGDQRKPLKKIGKYRTLQELPFISRISHDIRTDLNAICGYTDMIIAHQGEEERIAEYRQNIKNSEKSILRVLKNTVELTRLYNGALHESEELFSVEAMLQNLMEQESFEASQKGVKIIKVINVRHEFLRSDLDKIECILGNLLNNAVKYSEKGGVVKITATEQKRTRNGRCRVEYSISDQGQGMTEEFLDKIYHYVSSDSDEVQIQGSNSGIGLVLAKGLTDYLGGNFEIESYIDFGTNVKVMLSHRVADLSEFAKEDLQEKVEFGLNGKRILLAEDNELNRLYAVEILKEAGCEVDCVQDGIVCVAKLETEKAGYYDCILMDLMMPNLDGISATKIIRNLEDQDRSKIPIIAMTASVMNEDREKALLAGMNGFVEKPLDVKRLFEIMKNVIMTAK